MYQSLSSTKHKIRYYVRALSPETKSYGKNELSIYSASINKKSVSQIEHKCLYIGKSRESRKVKYSDGGLLNLPRQKIRGKKSD